MKLKKLITFLLLIFVAGCSSVRTQYTSNPSPSPYVVVEHSDSIQRAIDSLPATGGTIFIKAGTYVLTKGLYINKSNVSIIGERGVKLKLADYVNQPVILIGSGDSIPKINVENVEISNIEIDGNKKKQDSEFDPDRPWLRNNGIDARMVKNLWIKNVNIHDCRSGGIVVSWDSSNIFIDASMFNDNFYDGIALYASKEIIISNFVVYNNNAAGISLDNNLREVAFNNGLIKGNGDVGIFIRSSKDINFSNLIISSNKSHGCFISHGNILFAETGVNRCFFCGCSFLNNNGWGVWLASSENISPGNVVASSLFSGNKLGPIHIDSGGFLEKMGNVFQKIVNPNSEKSEK